MSIDHVLLTRFNLPSKGPESLIRAQDGWLQRRVGLFEKYTIPSVAAQSVSNFRWIVYFDPESPRWLLERLAPHVESGRYLPIFRDEATWREVGLDVRQLFAVPGRMLITTNLDNDDALAVDFVERVQRLATFGETRAIFLEKGLIAANGRLYIRRDSNNAFCSVAEPWTAQPNTAWRDWHIMLGKHMPVVADTGAPAWLQVVHGENVSNRVRGLLTDPAHHQSRFPSMLDDMPRPPTGAVALDLLLAAPLRGFRERMRALAKWTLMLIGGKRFVHQVALLMRRR